MRHMCLPYTDYGLALSRLNTRELPFPAYDAWFEKLKSHFPRPQLQARLAILRGPLHRPGSAQQEASKDYRVAIIMAVSPDSLCTAGAKFQHCSF